LKRKKGFPYVLIQSENNLVEAEQNIGSEKKRKNWKIGYLEVGLGSMLATMCIWVQ
jgi:hypothetical protein